MKADFTHPRLGIPDDKFGMYSLVVKQPDERTAVVVIIYPPKGLRDASREVIEQVVMARKKGILNSIIEEIYKSYTSDPPDAAAAQNIADVMVRQAQALRDQTKEK